MGEERQVVVIGSGPAGAAAARELCEAGIPVTLLESGTAFEGGLLLRLGGQNLFRRMPPLEQAPHVATGDPLTLFWATLAPGGMSNNWTGAVPRFAPEDFTEGERLHERFRWPLTYPELAPYYEKVERALQITADTSDVPQVPAGYASYRREVPADWLDVQRAAREFGQDLIVYPLADGPPNLVVRQGTAFNSYSNIVQPLLRAQRLRFMPGAHVLQLEWSPGMSRVDGVLYHDRATGRIERIGASAVIVACGALGSAKLLLNSRSAAFPEGLGNSAGLLGRFLHDHPREWWSFRMDRARSHLAPAAYLTRLPYDRSAPLMATSWTLGTASLRDRIRSRFGLKGTQVGVQLLGTTVPSESCVARPSGTLKDEFGMPALEVCMHYSPAELENVVRARQHLMDVVSAAGGSATLDPAAATLHPGQAAHYGGTARMHADPKYGVTDGWNRLHDAPNVLVCDAACFTTSTEKNPTLTLMALAARAAARLAHDLRHA